MVDKKVHTQRSISEKEQAIQNAFGDYCNLPYYLHTVVIHDGDAEQGHYYSYIHDIKQDTWWKFSDIHVQIALEEDVLREGFGGNPHRKTTAYSLIYINKYARDMAVAQPASPFLMARYLSEQNQQDEDVSTLRNSVVADNESFKLSQSLFKI